MRVQGPHGFVGIVLEVGAQYGSWTVEGPELPKTTKYNRSHVRCVCGRLSLVRNNRLVNGETVACRSCAATYDVVSYGGAHKRVKRIKGVARNHKCYACGYDADHWAYQHNDESELRDLRNRPYSLDPKHYVAMCASCHKEYDLDHIVNVEGRHASQ